MLEYRKMDMMEEDFDFIYNLSVIVTVENTVQYR